MFEKILNSYEWGKVKELINSRTEQDVLNAINTEYPGIEEIAALLSPAADDLLEEMAQRSAKITRMRFGNTIQMYTPLYISNECTNSCIYCGFNCRNKIKRVTLTDEEVLREATIIYDLGFRHLLLLTGEDPKAVSVQRLASIAEMIHHRFASISIEVYPMSTEDYRTMANHGVDGLTVYQETYNRETYAKVHPAGKKRDFSWRIATPDRGGMAGLRKLGIGALLGLSDWRVDSFFTILHALYLTKKYWKSHIQISFPRLRHAAGEFVPEYMVTDRNLTQLICAARILLPDAGLALSTREPSSLRDNLLPLGITMMSAGSKTSPGGYSGVGEGESQFDIEDSRTPSDIENLIKSQGFDPVWKDWDRDFLN